MLLKKLIIKNFGCFSGTHEITFGDTLTLVIGDNGDGKTTIFDAIQSLLNFSEKHKNTFLSRFSKKAEKELLEGDDSKEMSLELLFTHKGQNFQLEKSCVFLRDGEKLNIPDTVVHTARVELPSGERRTTDANKLIQGTFSPSLQRFCLFRGESQLDTVNDDRAFGELLKTLSDISSFDAYKAYAENLANIADKNYRNELRRAANGTKTLTKKIENLELAKKELRAVQDKIDTTQKQLNEANELCNKFKNNYDVYTSLNDLIKEKEELKEKIYDLKKTINEFNPNLSLLEDLWILKDFNPVFEEFRQKVNELNIKKASLLVATQAKEEGKKEVREETKKSVLSILTPNQSALENLIQAERCEVCGRDAKKGSDAYRHMCDRLEELKKTLEGQKKNQPNTKSLFSSKYVEELNDLYDSLTGKTQFELNYRMGNIDNIVKKIHLDEKTLKDKTGDLTRVQNEINDVCNNHGIENTDNIIAKETEVYGEAQRSVGLSEGQLIELIKERESCKEKVDNCQKEVDSKTKSDDKVEPLRRTLEILSSIRTAFEEGRETNADQLLEKLEKKSNEYLSKLSAHDFYGFIKLTRKKTNDGKDHVIVELQDTHDEVITNPNGAQKTSEALAILFAIAELRENKTDDPYPLVFDAPTSSFSSGRESNFYEIINKFNRQCLILTKDLLTTDGQPDLDRIKKLNCKVLRINKKPDFTAGDLSTVESDISIVRG